ncbi:SIS domain-containing protein [Kitasatospora sp. NPDC094011]|uniref:SIS domain-containing protein n=1 Tax=Kitasatospora sp. NPDC094011 TaxID=3364090 RepID=UPI003824623D
MAHVDEEIASQPECWQRALELSPRHLPEPDERIAVIGCGTSFYIAQAYAALRESLGLGETDAYPASEFPAARRYDRVVALSRSGTTTEVLDALARTRAAETVAITADPRTPIGAAARHLVALEFADERSVVQTRFATTALALLRAHLGGAPADLPDQARAALDAPLPGAGLEARQFTFLGTGWSCGVAHEAALKVREASGSWTEAYPAMEYRHGPISVSGPDGLVWFLGEPPVGLVRQAEATGAAVSVPRLDPLAELIRVQRLAVGLAVRRGLDPDRPRHLTRSIVLDQP